jgi:hypothetical protein
LTRTLDHIEEFRKGDACIEVRDVLGQPCAGVPVSVEQEGHEFPFGCVVPDLDAFSAQDRDRYRARLDEVFNRVILAGQPSCSKPGMLRVDLAEPTHLGLLRLRLDQLAASGLSLEVHAWGAAAGMTEATNATSQGERGVGRRVAELYTLCFSHPAVSAIVWNGIADGEQDVRGGGLLRRDLAPKYAHKALAKLIGFQWHTRAAGMTDAEGTFRFRGFFGDYRVVVGAGEVLVDTIALRRPDTGGGHFSCQRFQARPGFSTRNCTRRVFSTSVT